MPRHHPPRIVHVIYALSTGGLENGLVNIINRTPPGRYEHVIVCITRADDFVGRITAEGVRVIELNKREGHDLGFYWRLWKLFRSLRPDIIHSRNLAALETQLLSMGNRGVRRVHGEHGREINDLDGSNRKYLLLRKAMRFLVDHYIAVSKDLQGWLSQRVGVSASRISQIYNGVDHARFAPGAENSADLLPAAWSKGNGCLVLGTVGRLTPVKDQASLLAALDIIRSQQPALFEQLRLIVVGDGPLRQALAEKVAHLGLESRVWLAGDRDDVPRLLQAMDVFVLPSLAEGISNTVLEAMSAGLPVVATRVGGNTELIDDGHTGRLVPVAEPAALAAVLSEMAADAGQRLELGGRARESVCRRFDWKRTVDAYLQVYDELLHLPANREVIAE